MRFRQKVKRIILYEFWPPYLFYLPFLPIWIIYSIRSVDLLYFTRINPKMKFGGFMQYSKYEIIKSIPEKYLVKSYFYSEAPKNNGFYKDTLTFPFIYKPDIGERGKEVNLFRTEEDFKQFINKVNCSFILQEYCDYPIELGVLYHRFPNGESHITSVVKKTFLHVTGNGKSTLEELAKEEIRAYNKLDALAKKFSAKWHQAIPAGEIIVLEEIGNHCRGTTFIDACELISPELTAVFDEIAKNIPDFYYGRFDLKVKSIEDLLQGKNIKIFELNGVNSEAAHIYDPKHNIFYAYKKISKELRTVFEISCELKALGVEKPNTTIEFLKALRKQLS